MSTLLPALGRYVFFAVRCGRSATEEAAVFKTVLAILTVLAVVALGGLIKLPLLPFRMARDLLRRYAPA